MKVRTSAVGRLSSHLRWLVSIGSAMRRQLEAGEVQLMEATVWMDACASLVTTHSALPRGSCSNGRLTGA